MFALPLAPFSFSPSLIKLLPGCVTFYFPEIRCHRNYLIHPQSSSVVTPGESVREMFAAGDREAEIFIARKFNIAAIFFRFNFARVISSNTISIRLFSLFPPTSLGLG